MRRASKVQSAEKNRDYAFFRRGDFGGVSSMATTCNGSDPHDIFISSNDDDLTRRNCHEIGMNNFNSAAIAQAENQARGVVVQPASD
jgi:hypothetical protein